MEHSLPDHPESYLEAAHLEDTLSVIQTEIDKLEKELGVGAEEERTVVVPEGVSGDEVVMLNILRMKLQTLHQLALAKRQAYFSRLDFIPDGGQKETYYLGRWGVLKTPEYAVTVVDWRSPIANLYYSGQVGPMSYEAPDGKMEGELTLKRMLTVEKGRIAGIFDSGIVSQDAYLQGVLGAISSDRLREIVTTIQAEQNIVIRHGLQMPLIVQGVAGSGKTTIALHRIAWLLYAHQETLAPSTMMIVAPNPLFLNYISAVLPDLGVEEVRQTTIMELCAQWLGKQMPKVRRENRLEEQLHLTDEERSQMEDVLRLKGSLQYKQALEDFLEEYQQRVIPLGDVRFGQAVLYTQEELRQIFLKQLRPFPLRERVRELQKYMRTRLKKVSGEIEQWLENACRERLDALLRRLPDGEERRARANKLLQSRDERMKEIQTEQKRFLKEYPETWPKMGALEVYGHFLEWLRDNWAETGIFEKGNSAALQRLIKKTGETLAKKEAAAEDLPALMVIGRYVYGMPRVDIRHVVVDEAQDFSPFHYQFLKERVGHDSFTMVGDLMQGIHGDAGLRDWEEVKDGVFQNHAHLCRLITSYRNTVEIMTLASAIARRHPVPMQMEAKPVLRHGEKPFIRQFPTEKARIAAISSQAEAWLKEGYHSIAIIEKTEEDCRALYKALPEALHARMYQGGDQDYRGGVMVFPSALVKGLEFDCVLVAQVGKQAYPDAPWPSRILYVLCTRPLHRLALFYTGELSNLMENVTGEEAIFSPPTKEP